MEVTGEHIFAHGDGEEGLYFKVFVYDTQLALVTGCNREGAEHALSDDYRIFYGPSHPQKPVRGFLIIEWRAQWGLMHKGKVLLNSNRRQKHLDLEGVTEVK